MAEKVQVNADKLKVLNAVMEKIEKDFGKGSIMRMNSQEVNDVPVIPTGSITLRFSVSRRRALHRRRTEGQNYRDLRPGILR